MPFKPNDPNINREGRPPKELAITDILRSTSLDVDLVTGKTKRQIMIENVISLAIKPNPERWAVEWIANRTEGTPIQTTITPYHEPCEVRVIG
jgi:hypothetical protein